MASLGRGVVLRASALCGLLCAGLAAAQNGFWIHPPVGGPTGDFSENLEFQIGSTQTLKWSSPYETVTVQLFQEDIGNDGIPQSDIIASEVEGSEYEWVVDVSSFDLDFSSIFFLYLVGGDDGDEFLANAHYFNITSDEIVSSSSSSSTTRSATRTTTATSSATTSRTSQPTDSDASPTPEAPESTSTASSAEEAAGAEKDDASSGGGGDEGGGLSTGAAIGMSVAFTLVLCAVGAAVFWLLRRRKRQQAQAGQIAELGAGGMYGEEKRVELDARREKDSAHELNAAEVHEVQ